MKLVTRGWHSRLFAREIARAPGNGKTGAVPDQGHDNADLVTFPTVSKRKRRVHFLDECRIANALIDGSCSRNARSLLSEVGAITATCLRTRIFDSGKPRLYSVRSGCSR